MGSLLGKNDTIKLGLEPVDGLILCNAVVGTELAGSMATTGDAASGALKDNEEVHTVDTNGRIILNAKIDVLLDTETKVAGGREVLGKELVLLDLQASLEDLLSLGATDSAVDGNLFIAADGEGADGVTGLGEDGSLAGQVFQDLGSTGKTIARFTDGDVQAELGDLDVSHRVGLGGRLQGQRLNYHVVGYNFSTIGRWILGQENSA